MSAPAPAPHTPDDDLLYRYRHLLACGLILLTILVFANSFPAAFIQDDLHIVKNNPLVQSPGWLRIFTSDYWYGIEYSGLYRPLTIFSLALNRLVTGTAPWGFHLVNVLLLGGSALLLWLMLPRWGVPRLAALAAALLFVVHPIHTEVVNEVVGRSELMVAFFALLALGAAREEGRRAMGAVIVCFALALLTKEHAIVLLALIPLFDLFTTPFRQIWRRRWPLYLGLLGITALWLLLRHYGVAHHGPKSLYSSTAVPLAFVPWDVRALTGLQYQGVYLFKLLLPYRLQAVYSMADLPPLITSLWSLRGILVGVIWIAALSGIAWGWRRRQWWALFALCYLVSFAPTANVLLPIGVTLAERLAYFPSLWFCAVLGCAANSLLRQQSLQLIARATLVTCLFAYAIVTVLRNRDFESEIRLWSAEVRMNPSDYLGWQSVAETLNANQRYEEAERAYRHLLQLRPGFDGALRSYAAFLIEHKRYAEALELIKQSLRLAEREGSRVGMAYDLNNLAQIYIELGDYGEALAALQRPEAAMTENQDYYFVLLGSAHEGKGEYAAAVDAFRRAKVYDRATPLRYGRSLFRLGRLSEAQLLLEEAVRISDNSAEAWYLLGLIHAGQGRHGQAGEAFRRAVDLAPENREYRQQLQQAMQ